MSFPKTFQMELLVLTNSNSEEGERESVACEASCPGSEERGEHSQGSVQTPGSPALHSQPSCGS